MEKYTVDIDKVLDDFEETEALKIDSSHKNTNASLLQSAILRNYNEENEVNVKETENALQNTLKSENINSNEKNSLCSDKDTLPQDITSSKCLKYLEMPDGSDEKNNSFNENSENVSEVSQLATLVKQDCLSNVLSTSTSEISQESKERQDSCESVSVHSTLDDVKLVDYDFLNSVKRNVEKVSESQSVIEHELQYAENTSNLHLVNTAMSENQIEDNFHELEGITWNSSDIQLEESQDKEQKIIENVSHLSTDTSAELIDKNLKDCLNEKKSDTEFKADMSNPPSSTTATPLVAGDDVAVLKTEGASASEEQVLRTSSSISDIEIIDGTEPIECNQRSHSPLVEEPDYDVASEDEDSGVSSEEGNSPLFFFNNQMFNYNDGAHANANEEIYVDNNFTDSTCDNETELEVCIASAVDDSCLCNSDMTENNASSSEAQIPKKMPCESSVNSQSPTKYTGARPKLDIVNQLSVPDACDSEVKEQNEIEIKNVEIDSVNSNELLGQDDENELVSGTFNCDISNKSSDLPTNTSCYTDSNTSSCVDSVEVKCDNEISVSTESSASTERDSSTISDTKTDNPPQRLPRPTTLDLPSRHITVSQTSGESIISVPGSNNLESETCTDFLSNETPVEESASEPLPSVRQQPRIGLVKPFWIPDADAPNCMHCGVKFTVIKRRHHCRACGKVLCSRCCNLRAKLAYLNKQDRICHPCYEILSSTSQNEDIPSSTADSQSSSSCGSSPNFSPSPQIPNDKSSWRPHPNNPDDYCSTIPPLQQIQLSGTRPPPTVMVPIGVLKRGNKPRREPKQVIFSDGIRPGGDLTDLTEPADVIPAYRRMGRKRVEKTALGDSPSVGSSIPFTASQRSRQKRVLVSDDEGPLPPIVLQIDNDKLKDEMIDWNQLLERMQDDDQKPVNFALLKNMHLFVKLTKLDCCFGKECWCFTSHGLCAVGQDEIMVILERLPGENTFPRGIIKLYTHIYDSASKGSTFEDLGHIIFPEQILGSSDHRGFLFVRPTFQCLSKLIVPNTPFLVAILIHKWEVPWAKVFPLRLMLRLGAECRYYPCALVSVRHRKPVFFEIGQTIMSVLADLRNYQFTIPVIPGLVVHMEEKKTCVNIPRNRYEKVVKVLNSNNVEHVLALGSNFSSEADSHLVCMQKEEGDYQTQAINIENTTRRVTGASFIVFSGALKSSSGLSAKFSIVEDGLLVQIPQETMVALHMALRDMKDLTIECGQINAAEPEEIVIIQWTRDDKKVNIGVRSPIDCRSLEGIQSLRIHTSTDYAGDSYLIRWTEVFFLEVDESSNSIQHEMVDPCRLAETIAQSCCMALAPYLDQLAESELTKIGLRVTLDSERDRVEYDIGARGKPLPAVYMNALDCALIPVILRLSGSAQNEPVSFELIFYILIK